MITILNDVPDNVAAFNAAGEIKREDFDNLVIPHLKNKAEKYNELNYFLYLSQSLPQTDAGSVLAESLTKINGYLPCQRAAIVCDDEYASSINTLNSENIRFFAKDDLYSALYWCHNGREITSLK